MEIKKCSQCGATLTDSVCGYCGSCYDIDEYEYSDEINYTGYDRNITDIHSNVSTFYVLVPVLIIIMPFVILISWIRKRVFGDIENDLENL